MSRRVAIIGSGLVGLWTARFCREAGFEVTVISAGPRTSEGNAGMIVPSHFEPLAAPGMLALGLKMLTNPASPLGIRFFQEPGTVGWLWEFRKAATADHVRKVSPILSGLHMASRELYAKLAQTMDFGFREEGLLMVCETDAQLAKERHVAELAANYGQRTALLSSEQVGERFGTEVRGVAGAVEFLDDAFLNPAQLLAHLEGDLRRGGVSFIDQQVNNLRFDTGAVVAAETSQGEIEADEFVIAAGIGSSPLCQSFGLNLPLAAGKGYSLTFPERGRGMSACALLAEARVAITPIGTDLRIAGTMELGNADQVVNPRRVSGIERATKRVVPAWQDLTFETERAWVGHRPVGPDGVPSIGRTRFTRNVTVAAGHGMMGVSLAPITGHLIANVLTGQMPAVPFDIMNPDRYAH